MRGCEHFPLIKRVHLSPSLAPGGQFLSFLIASIPFLSHQVCKLPIIKIKCLIFPIHFLSQTRRLQPCWHSSIPALVSSTAQLLHNAESLNTSHPFTLPLISRVYSKNSTESTLTFSLHLTTIFQLLSSLFSPNNKSRNNNNNHHKLLYLL